MSFLASIAEILLSKLVSTDLIKFFSSADMVLVSDMYSTARRVRRAGMYTVRPRGVSIHSVLSVPFCSHQNARITVFFERKTSPCDISDIYSNL